MLKRRTIFVVGAGASVEAGLPTGASLTQQIASMLDLRWEFGHRQEKGDLLIGEALTHRSRQTRNDGGWDITAEVHAARRISGAMIESLSIDNYMEAHNHDPNVMLAGKLAIARAISLAERKSKLWVNLLKGDKFDSSKVKDTWYQRFWQVLHQRVTKSEVSSIFDNITVISFNYDRCIQQRLFYGLKLYYSLSDQEALSVVSKLDILYPYGSLGDYSSPSVFGEEYDAAELLRVSEGIKTFSERIEDEECLYRIKSSLACAERVFFLGFAFHPQNMQLLASQNIADEKTVYATAFGIPRTNLDPIRHLLLDVVGVPAEVHVDFNTCCQFFDNYWYSLAAG